jgi:hypothetical protein
MRASLRALAVAALALTTASFAAAAKGGKASEDRKVSDFTGVEVQAGIRAIISIADRRVTVEGDEDSVARVRTEVHDGVLEIGWEKSGHLFQWNTGEVTVRVHTPRLRSVGVSGGAHAEVERLTESKARPLASGGGEVVVDHASARELEVEASGRATVRDGRNTRRRVLVPSRSCDGSRRG